MGERIMSEVQVILLALAVVVIVPVVYVVATYNRIVRLRQHIREAWADVDVELKRRHDLVPNLVETVRGYAAHERELLARLIELRNKAASDESPRALGEDETALQRQLGRVFLLAEAYPDLKADRHFLELQRELALTEDRLAAARRFYNGNVRELNSLVQSFPSNIVAGMAGATTSDYFEVAGDAERVAPRVQM
jgi:LemA protein